MLPEIFSSNRTNIVIANWKDYSKLVNKWPKGKKSRKILFFDEVDQCLTS